MEVAIRTLTAVHNRRSDAHVQGPCFDAWVVDQLMIPSKACLRLSASGPYGAFSRVTADSAEADRTISPVLPIVLVRGPMRRSSEGNITPGQDIPRAIARRKFGLSRHVPCRLVFEASFRQRRSQICPVTTKSMARNVC
jgi:hypothetical protein